MFIRIFDPKGKYDFYPHTKNKMRDKNARLATSLREFVPSKRQTKTHTQSSDCLKKHEERKEHSEESKTWFLVEALPEEEWIVV